ncbi:HD domain-containing protein [Streptomyces sp. NPDC048172]|uniref:HD domain-containing protein n=1 Tax=Streptomyces sp. NPDC048172 TaxID=3365505 RepID=UPI00371F090C
MPDTIPRPGKIGTPNEALLGDPHRRHPWVCRRHLKAIPNQEVTANQVADAHPKIAAGIQAIIDEYETGDSLEVLVAKDAAKLECVIQAVEYIEQGYSNAVEWRDSTRAKLSAPSTQARNHAHSQRTPDGPGRFNAS